MVNIMYACVKILAIIFSLIIHITYLSTEKNLKK